MLVHASFWHWKYNSVLVSAACVIGVSVIWLCREMRYAKTVSSGAPIKLELRRDLCIAIALNHAVSAHHYSPALR